MKKILIWSVFALILIMNYQLQPTVLEDTRHISAIGYDTEEDHLVKATAAVPFFPPGENAKPINVTFTATGHTSKSVQQLFQTKSQKQLSLGRLNDVLYSKDTAKKGLFPFIHPFSRAPSIGRDIHLAVVDGKTEDMLKQKYPNTLLTSQYVTDLLDQGLKDIIPKTNLHSFLAQYYGNGQDPFLPLLKLQKQNIKLKGLALFKEDRYISSLSYEDSYLFKLLYENSRYGLYNIQLKDGTYVTIENVRSKVKYHIDGTKENPTIKIDLSLLGQINDASGITIQNMKKTKDIEKQWQQDMKQKTEKVVNHLQELQVDSLGIGERVRSKHRHFNMETWKQSYPTVPIKINVQVKTMDTGIVE